MRFYDRQRELRALRARLADRSSLNLVFGQRRIGKTWLLRHLLDGEDDAVFFMADQSTASSLLARLASLVGERGAGGPAWADVQHRDWATTLSLLVQSAAAEDRRLVLVLDEVQYLIDAEPALPSILQRLWDEFHDRVSLHLILCGSALGTLSALGEAGRPLHGRFDLRMKLRPFGFREAAEFAPGWSRADHLRLYGVFGGMARHLAYVVPERSLAENAAAAILDPLAPLHDAPPDLLRTENVSAHAEAHATLAAIAAGENRFGPIAARTGLDAPKAAHVLRELQALDVIERQTRFGDKPRARFARYHCHDPFVTFWFRHVVPHRVALIGTEPLEVWHRAIAPALDDHMGPVFEKIVGQALLAGALGAGPVQQMAPYWTRDGRTELDWVVATDSGRFLVECKWRPGGRVGVSDLGRLRGHAERSGLKTDTTRLCLATAGEFTDELRTVAAAEDVVLLGASELFESG